jgi:hypothetical protein
MTPGDVEHSNTVVRSREQVIRARRRRQTYTFLTVFALVLLAGGVALGNWQQWWTLGGSAPAAATVCPAQTFIEPELTSVNVINGTYRRGLAAAVAKELQRRRFKVATIETEEQRKPIKAVVQVRYGAPGKLAARTVALQFPAKVVMIDDKRDSEDVDVVIGNAYKAMVSAKKGAAAIRLKPEPRGCLPATSAPSGATAGTS